MSVVTDVVLPGLEDTIQTPYSIALLSSDLVFELVEGMGQEVLFSEVDVQYLDPAVVLKEVAVAQPSLEDIFAPSEVLFLEDSPELEQCSLFELSLLFPNVEVPLLLAPGLSLEPVPDHVDGVGLEVVVVVSLLMELFQSVEDFGLELVAVDYDRDVFVLEPGSIRFQGFVVPLVEGSAQAEVSCSLHPQSQSLKLGVALAVESAVAFNFGEDVLLSTLNHNLKGNMKFLESDELDLPAVVVVNVPFGEVHVSHCIIVPFRQILDLNQQVLSVILEPVDIGLEIRVFMAEDTVVSGKLVKLQVHVG